MLLLEFKQLFILKVYLCEIINFKYYKQYGMWFHSSRTPLQGLAFISSHYSWIGQFNPWVGMFNSWVGMFNPWGDNLKSLLMSNSAHEWDNWTHESANSTHELATTIDSSQFLSPTVHWMPGFKNGLLRVSSATSVLRLHLFHCHLFALRLKYQTRTCMIIVVSYFKSDVSPYWRKLSLRLVFIEYVYVH